MSKYYKGFLTVPYIQNIIQAQGSIRGAARFINSHTLLLSVTESGIRNFLKINGITIEETPPQAEILEATKDSRPIAAGSISAPDTRRKRLAGQRFVFTSAQNNTYIHEDFFASLLRFCEFNDAQLYVSRFTYNKAGFQNGTKESKDLWYDHRLEDYILDESVEVASQLIFCGELDVLPTAIDPLSGFEGYTQGNSGIVPHAKVALKSMPRLKGEDPRFLYTTGAITQRNYIQRKAGQKADFHHVFGALYVEVDDNGVWFARQLIADNKGEFYDLTKHYTPSTEIPENVNVKAINWGDIHIEKYDQSVLTAGWEDGRSMAQTLNPEYQFIHDLTDFSARNHHNIHDPLHLANTHFRGTGSVEEGLLQSAHFINNISRYGYVVVVDSNHHDAYLKWLTEADIKKDPENAEFYYRSNAAVYRAIREDDKEFDVYEWALKLELDLPNVLFLKPDESFVICNDESAEEIEGKIIGGIECGIHGHQGPNGARGNSKQFKHIGRKCNLGHSHSAAILDGVYVAGVSGSLDMGYNKGPSSWSHSHIVTYQNGKRAIITMKDGKWRA